MAISDDEDGAFDDGAVRLDLARESGEGVNVGLDLKPADAVGDEEGVHAGGDAPAHVDFGDQNVWLGTHAAGYGRDEGLTYVGVAHGPNSTAGRAGWGRSGTFCCGRACRLAVARFQQRSTDSSPSGRLVCAAPKHGERPRCLTRCDPRSPDS